MPVIFAPASDRRSRACISMPYTLRNLQQAMRGLLLYQPDATDTVAFQLERHASHHPERACLRYRERVFSYGQANAEINRYAHAYRALGIERGDVVAIMLENRP